MFLFIDTSEYDQTQLALVDKQVKSHVFLSVALSEKLVLEIKKFLKKESVKLNSVKKIGVVVGPGGFSRIRTAVSTANALAFGLNIPIVAIEKSEIPKDLRDLLVKKAKKMVEPKYDREPNITLSKK
jgi:tRNA A37 threonylcarbamoyladenosine modification protein TsaB